MIDLKALRDEPQRFRQGAVDKGTNGQLVDDLLASDKCLRATLTEREQLGAQKNRISKQIGALAGRLAKADASARPTLEAEMRQLREQPSQIKQRESELAQQVKDLQSERDRLWFQVPQPAISTVPVGQSEQDNVELRRWNPPWFDPNLPFDQNKGFAARSHIDLGLDLGLVSFDRGVKMAGTRSYVLTRAGMLLHQAVLRLAFDFMIHENHFTPVSVPVLVREQMMFGTAFFPHAKDECYEIAEAQRGGGHDLYLTGTGEVGLMGYRANEILDPEIDLPACYTTVSTCFRREAGASGKDTAGLYRIHQFDKVEQVVLCQADPQESRQWHEKMIGFVETLLQRLELPYRLLQVCTTDMGAAKADQVDVDCWMPSRGEPGPDGEPTGAYGETHSASQLHDYQTRRLNIRYRNPDTKKNVFCHSLNNTVVASPRILIPIVELYQNKDGSITVPGALRPYMNDMERIEKA